MVSYQMLDLFWYLCSLRDIELYELSRHMIYLVHVGLDIFLLGLVTSTICTWPPYPQLYKVQIYNIK